MKKQIFLLFTFLITSVSFSTTFDEYKNLYKEKRCDGVMNAYILTPPSDIPKLLPHLDDKELAPCVATFIYLKSISAQVTKIQVISKDFEKPLQKAALDRSFPVVTRLNAALALSEISKDKIFSEKIAPELLEEMKNPKTEDEAYHLILLVRKFPAGILSLEPLFSGNVELEKQAFYALASLKKESAPLFPFIEKRMKTTKGKILEQYISSLQEIGTQEALDLIEKYKVQTIPDKYKKLMTKAPELIKKIGTTFYRASFGGTPGIYLVNSTDADLSKLRNVTAVTDVGVFELKPEKIETTCKGFCDEKTPCHPIVSYRVPSIKIPNSDLLIFPGWLRPGKIVPVIFKEEKSKKDGCKTYRSGQFEKEICNPYHTDSGRTTVIRYKDQVVLSTYQDYGSGGVADLLGLFSSKGADYYFVIGQSKFQAHFGVISLKNGIVKPKIETEQTSMICDG